MASLPRSCFCPACAQAQGLVNRLADHLDRRPPPPADEVIELLPLLLETALADVLAEFDPAANPHARIARAVRLLTMGAERAQALVDARLGHNDAA